MAFIKRSSFKPVDAEVGRTVLSCRQCGKPVVVTEEFAIRLASDPELGQEVLCDQCKRICV